MRADNGLLYDQPVDPSYITVTGLKNNYTLTNGPQKSTYLLLINENLARTASITFSFKYVNGGSYTVVNGVTPLALTVNPLSVY